MEAAFFFDVFNGKLIAVLKAENSFMLCAVIHINSVNLFHSCNKNHIDNKDDNSD